MGGRCLHIASRGDHALVSLLLEAILLEARKGKVLNPVVIDVMDPPAIAPQAMHKDKNIELGKFYRSLGPGDVPLVNAESFHLGTIELIKKKQAPLLAGTDFIILASEKELSHTLEHVTELWLLCSPDSSSASLVYRLIDMFPKRLPHPPKIIMSIIGLPYIESAAAEFVRIRDEVRHVRSTPFDLVFAGILYADTAKTELVFDSGLNYLEVFPGDSLHGQIKRNLTQVISETSPVDSIDAIKATRRAVYTLVKEKGHKAADL